MSGGTCDCAGLTRVHGAGRRRRWRTSTSRCRPARAWPSSGPSGSGKSTVLRLTAGLDEPTAGSVRLDGVDLAGVAPERRGMAMVFQRPLLFPHLTCATTSPSPTGSAGCRAGRPGGGPRSSSTWCSWAATGRGRPARCPAGRSSGWRWPGHWPPSRGCCCWTRPFSALDAGLREEMHELLADLRMRLDPTILLVTHDHAEADALADTVAVLDGGRLLQTGPMRALYTRPGVAGRQPAAGRAHRDRRGGARRPRTSSALGDARAAGARARRAGGARRPATRPSAVTAAGPTATPPAPSSGCAAAGCARWSPSRWRRRRPAPWTPSSGPVRTCRAGSTVGLRLPVADRCDRAGSGRRCAAAPRATGHYPTTVSGSSLRSWTFSVTSRTECCAQAGTSCPVSGCAIE